MNTKHYIYLAPFQGITGIVFREIYTKHFTGVDKLYTPFFTGIYNRKNLTTRSDKLDEVCHYQIPLTPQILSKDTDEIMRFAKFCAEKDYTEINWNLGCPYPRVTNKKRGSGMLPYPEMVEEILENIQGKLPLKFSVKCRLGFHKPEEIFDLIPVFNKYNISELIIHARIGKQLYKGQADTEAFKKCISMSEKPLVYNGDIFSTGDFYSLQQQFPGINRWMIGRGLLMDPFLPGDIKEVVFDGDRKTKVKQFVMNLYLAYRKKMNDRLQAISVMKELWGFLRYSFDEPHKVFNRIKKCKSFDAYEQAVSDIFNLHVWVGADGNRYRQLNSETES
jgi:tRNA-dihydrouridine synthase